MKNRKLLIIIGCILLACNIVGLAAMNAMIIVAIMPLSLIYVILTCCKVIKYYKEKNSCFSQCDENTKKV